ncbi:hypothetical protein AB1N83_009236 [Pleurotus pulmonarius]
MIDVLVAEPCSTEKRRKLEGRHKRPLSKRRVPSDDLEVADRIANNLDIPSRLIQSRLLFRQPRYHKAREAI